MNLVLASRSARTIMDRHGLYDWTFKFDGAKRRAGLTNYTDRIISLSKPLTTLHDEHQVTQTTLHEVAHALAGFEAAHGDRWLSVARSIGYEGGRCGSGPVAPPNWHGVCDRGHVASSRYRRPRQGVVFSCLTCYPHGFNPDYPLSWMPATLSN